MTTIDRIQTSPSDWYFAAGCVAALFIVTAWFLPNWNDPTDLHIRGETAYLGFMVLLYGLIATSLTLVAVASPRKVAMAWLASGFAFVAAVAVVQLSVLLGGLMADASDIERASVDAHLMTIWHVCLPLGVIAHVVSLGSHQRPAARGVPPPAALHLVPAGAAIVLAAAIGYIVNSHPQTFPSLLSEEGAFVNTFDQLSAAAATLSCLALVMLLYVTRLRQALYVWLALSMMAFAMDSVVVLLVHEKYALGWYLGRMLSLAAGLSMLMAMLTDLYRMYREAETQALFHEEEARRDALTGLFNRRFLERRLEEEFTRARRYGHPLSVLILDIDHFKRINDEHGHHGGDECLRSLAQLLDDRINRGGDFVARFGGEEFVVVLPESHQEGAVELAEEIRQRVAALPLGKASPIQMTVSIGVATAQTPEMSSAAELLKKADGNLYQAKALGRNRVVATTPQQGWKQRLASGGGFEQGHLAQP